jgi:hypothetical protein
MGSSFTVADTGTRVAVLGYDDTGTGDTGTPGTRYRDLHVTACAAGGEVQVSNAPWSLIGADSSNNADIVVGGGLHEPQYPGTPDLLNKGECVSGWISFQVPNSVAIVAAKYAPNDDNGNPLPTARWRLKQ